MWNLTRWLVAVVVLGAAVDNVGHAQGQSIGTFRWQLQPYCNIITLTITQNGGVYTLDGADDQCGAAPRASVVGTAFLNPDGSVGIGLTTVLAPGGTAVHVDARIQLGSLGGPWRDSAGNNGTFVFTPGPSAGGPPRPVAANGLPPGSITAAHLAPGVVNGIHLAPGAVGSAQLAPGTVGVAHLAPGVVGAAQINAGQVQVRVGGTCPVGQYLSGIHANGAVVCERLLLTPNVSTTADGQAGAHSSIAIGTDGLPIVSHLDEGLQALRVTHCGNSACTMGNVSTTVDDSNNSSVGQYTSIAIGADGLPIISHYDQTAGALRVTHCGNTACTSGTVSTTVDDQAASIVGLSSSIAIGADGLPVISHYDFTAGAVRVTHCGNAACTAGNVTTTVDDPSNIVGGWTSIAIGADGLPIVSYADQMAGALRVTHCGNAACTAGNVSTTVDDPAGSVGLSSSIAIGADGLPVISYWDQTAGALRVTHCGNAACTAGSVSTTVDDPAQSVGVYTSIAIGTDGLPIISHRDETAFALRVTHCGNVACTAGNVSATVDDPPNSVGLYTSIAIGAEGLPIISHRDEANGLRVTKCATRTCQ